MIDINLLIALFTIPTIIFCVIGLIYAHKVNQDLNEIGRKLDEYKRRRK